MRQLHSERTSARAHPDRDPDPINNQQIIRGKNKFICMCYK